MLRLSVLFTLVLYTTLSQGLSLDTPPVPGGIAVITLPANTDPASAHYGDTRVLVTKKDDRHIAIVGLPLATKPGRHFLRVTDRQGKPLSLGFQVEDKPGSINTTASYFL